MKSYKARGIVLSTLKYGESATIVYMLTDVLGRHSYMVQGARSSGRGRGNKSAMFQPMFRLEFEGFEPPRAQMHRMRDVTLAEPYTTIPFDIRKSTISLFMAEVLYRLVRESEPNSPLFDFVCDAATALDGMRDGVANFHLWFLVGLSGYLGFYPGNEYTGGDWFDIREGVFSHSMPSHRMALSQANSELLARLMECTPDELHTLNMPRSQRSDFLGALTAYFAHHLDSIHDIRSVQMFKELF